MKLSPVLNRHVFGRWFNDLWKGSKEVTIADYKLRKILEEDGKKVYDANALFASAGRRREASDPASAEAAKPLVDEPPSAPRHDTPAFLYNGYNLLLGLPQAQAITNTIVIGDGLPERVLALEGVDRLAEQDDLVCDVIKSALMFDATQVKLSKVIDITRLGLQQPREYGIPPLRANTSLLAGLLSLCQRLAGQLDSSGDQHRMVLHKPLLSATSALANGRRLLLRRRPELALLADRPLAAVAPTEAVAASCAAASPSVNPVSPYVNLDRLRQYHWQDVAPVSAACRHRHVHTLLVGWNGRLLKYVDDGQLGALSLMMMYAAALNMRRQRGVEQQPVTLQCVATDGRHLKLSVFQLNSTAAPEVVGGQIVPREEPKNMLWSEPAVPLYDRCGYLSGRAQLTGYNPDVFPRLMAMYAHGLLADTVDRLE